MVGSNLSAVTDTTYIERKMDEDSSAAGRNPLPIEDPAPPSQPPSNEEPLKMSGLPSVPPVPADSPKPAYPLLSQPWSEMPKSDLAFEPGFVPPELRPMDSLAKVIIPKQDLKSASTFSPSAASPQFESPKISVPVSPQPISSPEAQPVFKKPANTSPAKPVFGVRSSVSSGQSPWISASKPEESKEVSRASVPKYVFKSGPPPPSEAPKPQPKPQAVPLPGPEEANKPKTLLDEIREKACLRPEDPNEWECQACHLYNRVEFIQCETCAGENKVLAGVLIALGKPGQKREKGLVAKGVETAKSWLGW